MPAFGGENIITSPHVVVLGAGASVAAIPKGDPAGRIAPVMDNFVDALGLGRLLTDNGVKYAGRNFEDIFDELWQSGKAPALMEELEQAIKSYFLQLELPSTPTVYDHLVLSLRAKDLIVTFNWDTLLNETLYRFSVPPYPHMISD